MITLRAEFYDEKGDFHGRKNFSKHDKTFKYGKGAYNVDLKNSSFRTDKPFPILFFWNRRTYIYNTELSNPILLDKKAEPPISPNLYNINLETRVMEKLNDLSKTGIMALLTPRNIIIFLIILGFAIYLGTGNSLMPNGTI